jgi:hypothetical protein
LVNRLVIGSLLALILGLSVGMPVLFKTVTFGEPPKVYADIVYAYFSLLPSNQSVPGLQREQFLSFMFILNVTNLSNEVVAITQAQAVAAPQMEFLPTTRKGNQVIAIANVTISNPYTNENASSNFEWSNATQVRYQDNGSLAFGFADSIATSSQNYEGNEYYWNENASRLLILSGILQLPPWGLATLQNKNIFVFSHVDGEAISNSIEAYGAYVIKGVQLENFGDREFVFNELFEANETLHFDPTGVPYVSGN